MLPDARRPIFRHRRHAQAEELHQGAHPLGVTLRQVVVDRDDVHPLARQRETGRRHRADQRLALTGGHLDDVALHQAEHRLRLHRERLEAERAVRRHPQHGQEGRRILETAGGELACPLGEGGVVKLRELGVLRLRLLHQRAAALLVARLRCAHRLPEPVKSHATTLVPW